MGIRSIGQFTLISAGLILAANSAQGSVLTLNTINGNGPGNNFTPTLATVGQDCQVADGTSSTGPSGGLLLSLNIGSSAALGVISSVLFKAKVSCAGCGGGDGFNFWMKQGATFTDPGRVGLTGVLKNYTKTFATNPVTSLAWAWTDINAMSVGLMSVGGGGITVSVDYYDVEVTYDAIPTISLTAPASNTSVVPGKSVPITISATDPDGANVSVYYTKNTVTCGASDSTLIQGGLTESSTTSTWSTTSVPPGTYSICAVINDGINPAVTAYAPGKITLSNTAAGYDTYEISGGCGTLAKVSGKKRRQGNPAAPAAFFLPWLVALGIARILISKSQSQKRTERVFQMRQPGT
ncbi:MAG: Ig-like domain-containing protein [Bdellovibrionota bacterium]